MAKIVEVVFLYADSTVNKKKVKIWNHRCLEDADIKMCLFSITAVFHQTTALTMACQTNNISIALTSSLQFITALLTAAILGESDCGTAQAVDR